MHPQKLARIAAGASTLVLALSLTAPAHAVDVWAIGTADDSNTEFLVEPTPGAAVDGPYSFDVDTDTNPDDFIRYLVGPDEGVGGDYQPDDFNPLTITYTTDCALLPGSDATLTVDLALVRNEIDDPLGNDGTVAWTVDIGGAASTVTFTGIDTPGGSDAPSAFGFANAHSFPVTQAQLGADIMITADDGWWISFDALSLAGDCVTDSAKISGKIGAGSGKGNGAGAPTHTFSGVVGNDTDGEAVGEILVNYRPDGELPTTCTYTPTTPVAYSLDGVLDVATFDADYVCVGGIYDTYADSAMITLTNRDKGNDRGAVEIDAADDELDVDATLEKGNVIVTPPAP